MATPSTSRSGNASTGREDLRQALAEKLIEQIEAGTARWQKPWQPGEVLAPINVVTGKPYRGVNREWLSVFSPDHSDPRWCTYKQAKEQGWQVREGEKGTRIEVWKEYEHKRTQEELETIRAERGKMDPAVLENLGEIPLVEKRLGVRYYSVFHASQIDGIPPLERPDIDHEVEGKPDERLPKLAAAMGVSLQYGGGRAFYRTASDHVQMPPVETFEKAVGHDTTLLHELSHATGHESRLSRKLGNPFGSPEYAVEELRAEMSAAMTAASLGLGFDPAAQDVEQDRELGNSAAYLASWLKALPENERKQTIMQAIKDAQVISDYLLERTPEIERTVELAQREMSTTVPEKLVPWLSNSQRLATEEGLRGEDRSFFAEKMQELERIIEKMPITYDTDGKPDAEKPVGLRYFGPGGAQWFIIEKDRGDPEREGPGEPRQLQAFGLADLGYGEPEIGYINIEEITKNPRVELDYHFEPTNLLEIKKEHYPDMVRRIAMGESLVQDPAMVQSARLDSELVAHLEERGRIRQGESSRSPEQGGLGGDEWPGGLPTGLGGDRVANAEQFIRGEAMRNPDRAERWAEILRGNPQEYAERLGLEADNIRGIATQMEEGAKRARNPQVGDLARFETNDELLRSNFTGRVIGRDSTSGGDIRYRLRAEAGPYQGVETLVYGRGGSFRAATLEEARGFDQNTPERLAEAEKSLAAIIDPKEQAVIDYNRFHQTLPSRTDQLIQDMEKRFAKVDMTMPNGQELFRKAVEESSIHADQVFGIIREGGDRGAFKPELDMVNAGVDPDRRSEVHAIWQDTSYAQHVRYRKAEEKAREQVTERVKERGKAVLKSGKDLMPRERAEATYWKHGIVIGQNSPMMDSMFKAVEEKGLGRMISMIGTNSQNPASEEVFSQLTGIKLGKTQKERVAQLEAWAGPEKVAELKTAQEAAAQKRKMERDHKGLRYAYDGMNRLNVRVYDEVRGEITVKGQDYLSRVLSEGFDRVTSAKAGAVTKYRIHNTGKESYHSMKSHEFNDFCISVLAVDQKGNIPNALRTVGIPVPNRELSDFLRERSKVLHGKHPDYADNGREPAVNAENFVRKAILQDSLRGYEWAKELREHPEMYTAIAGDSKVINGIKADIPGLAKMMDRAVEEAMVVDLQQKYRELTLTHLHVPPLYDAGKMPGMSPEGIRDLMGRKPDDFAPGVEMVPVQKVAGRILDSDGYSALILDTREFGAVLVDTNVSKFLWNDAVAPVFDQAKAQGEIVTLAISDDGKKVSLNDAVVDLGKEPAIPYGLMTINEKRVLGEQKTHVEPEVLLAAIREDPATRDFTALLKQGVESAKAPAPETGKAPTQQKQSAYRAPVRQKSSGVEL